MLDSTEWQSGDCGDSLRASESHSSPYTCSSGPTTLKCVCARVRVCVCVCLTLCDPMDCIIHGILQARILELVAFPFSRASSQPQDQTQVSHVVGGFFTS